MTKENIFTKLSNNGFEVKGRYIYRRSERTNIKEVRGYVNEKSLHFFSENVYPFKHGTNFFGDETLASSKKELSSYYEKVKENERNDFNVSFEQYRKTTKKDSIFTTWANNSIKDYLTKDFINYFDIRGISKGYMQNSVAFPFFDINNNFITAQILKYGSNGKRLHTQYSKNWYHTYKPIKAELGLKDEDTYSVKIPCFFGENHLKDSDNIVAIVEAPKTAVILKEFYPNIDWIATAGEQALFNKDLDVLIGKTVVLFPDAYTTKWKEFADKKGYYCSDILETKGVEAGDDLADYIFKGNSEIHSKLHELLYSLNVGEFDLKLNKDLLELDFQIVGKEKGYFTAVPHSHKQNDILHQWDNSKDFKISLKGKFFNIYSKKENIKGIEVRRKIPESIGYSILNANIDWHKQERKEGEELMGMTKNSFIWHLQKCFRTLKHLNDKDVYLDVFETTLDTLLSKSNFRFNKAYVLNRLVPIWEGYNANLDRFKKYRDWKYKGGEQLLRKEFEKELNNDKFRSKLNMHLLSFDDVLKEYRFIDIETDLGLTRSIRGYSKVKELVNQWNKEVIGCKTLKTYRNKLDFISKITNRVKSAPPYIGSSLYSGAYFTRLNLSISEAMRIAKNKNNKAVKSFLSFIPDETIKYSIIKEVNTLLDNITDVVPTRQIIGDTNRIHNFEVIESVSKNSDALLLNLTAKEAFGTLEELEQIDKSILSESQVDFFEYEFNYLSLLKEINSFSYFERKDIFTNEFNRNDFLNNYSVNNRATENNGYNLKTIAA